MSVAELPYILEELPDSGKILEVGVGDPPFFINNKLKKEGYDVYGIDLKYENEKEKIVKCDIEKDDIPFKNGFFDTVLMMCIIEHLGKPIKVLKKIYPLLKKDGLLIVTSYDFFRLNNIKSIILKREQDDFRSLLTDGDYEGHIRVYTKKELLLMLEYCGFKAFKGKSIRDYLLVVGKK